MALQVRFAAVALAACLAASCVPALALAGPSDESAQAETPAAASSQVAGAADDEASSSAAAKKPKEGAAAASYALLSADGWLYRADKKGAPLKDGRIWAAADDGANPLANVEKLFVAADVPALGLDAQSGRDYAHPAIELRSGKIDKKARVCFGAAASRGDLALVGLESVKFLLDDKGESACASIGDAAFSGSALSKLVNLDKTALAAVGAQAFHDCDKLASITLPESCTALGRQAFAGCDALSAVTLRSPEAVTLLDKSAFDATPLANPFKDGAHFYVPDGALGSYTSSLQGEANRWLRYRQNIAAMPDLAEAQVKVGSATFAGKGKQAIPPIDVRYDGAQLEEGLDYRVSFSGNDQAGVGLATITGQGAYEGVVKESFGIAKAENPLVVEAEDVSADYFATLFGKSKVKDAISVKKARGKLTYKLVEGDAQDTFAVKEKTGAIVIAQGAPEGTYELKVKVTAAGDENYLAGSKTVALQLSIDRANNMPSAYKFMSIAQQEYEEGVASGTMHKGDSKYWKAFVSKYQLWCSEFVGWCLQATGLQRGVTMPQNPTYAKAYYNFYSSHPELATIHENDGSYKPKPGDIVLQMKNGGFEHTEMITWVDGSSYGGISGGTRVTATSRSLSNKQFYYFITLDWDAIRARS